MAQEGKDTSFSVPTTNGHTVKKEERSLLLRIIQLNDVYTLDNFPNIATLIKHFQRCGQTPDGGKNGSSSSLWSSSAPDETLVVLAGDFLSPSLLSSLDKGRGMIDVMNMCGVTHVCVGNHEADISTDHLQSRIRESNFVWLNTNMRELDKKLNVVTKEHGIVTVKRTGGKKRQADGTVKEGSGRHERRVALLGLLTEDEHLYRKGAFGDAKIDPVMEKTRECLSKLRQRRGEHCDDDPNAIDLVVPLTHQDMTRDREFCSHFTGDVFPVVIGGHDHEVYDETHSESRIVKTGMDGRNAAIIDIEWMDAEARTKPTVTVDIVDTKKFDPDPDVAKRIKDHERILEELYRAKLFRIDTESGEEVAFSTKNNRLQPTNGSTIIVAAIRRGMRSECAIFNAGAIRGDRVYTDQTWFTWSDLKVEIPFSAEITTVSIPGKVLSSAIAYSREGSYQTPQVSSGGYLQTCDMIVFDDDKRVIQSIRGETFDPERLYLAAVPIKLFNGLDSNVPILDWAKANKPTIDEESGKPAKMVIVELFATSLWLELGSFADIDTNGDGMLQTAEVRAQAERVFGSHMADLVVTNLMALADMNNDGVINREELLATRFIATDMMKHVHSSNEGDVLTRLACEVLTLPPSHVEVKNIVKEVLKRIDVDGDGKIDRMEAMMALGKLKSRPLLS